MHRKWQILSTAIIIGLYKLLELRVDFENGSLFLLAMPLVILLGIPHGATDYLLNEYAQAERGLGTSRGRFILKYLLFIAGYGMLWVLSPVFSLIVFLLISAYHFGETHWQGYSITTGTNSYAKLIYLLWGVSLLSTLFTLYPEATAFYLQGIINESRAYIFKTSIQITGFFALASWIGLAYFTVNREAFYRQILEYVLLSGVFYFTDLLVGFTIFFTIWHSWDAIALQLQGLRKKTPEFDMWAFATAAFPFTMISLIGMAGIVLFFQWFSASLSPITVFLILIALVTLPHQFEVTQFYDQMRIKK